LLEREVRRWRSWDEQRAEVSLGVVQHDEKMVKKRIFKFKYLNCEPGKKMREERGDLPGSQRRVWYKYNTIDL
jgi:hypothetical protein